MFLKCLCKRSGPLATLCLLVGAACLCGCNTLEGKVAAGAWGATALAAQSPAHEVEQIYYLGVFDPHEQVPPSVYRVRVHGQASFMSRTNFASGWVQASLVDSLGTSMSFNNESGSWNVSKVEERETAKLKTGRRQMLFGPMGFREQPADHRLCIVMGANPDKWFQAMDEALGVVADAVSEKRVGALKSDIFDAIATAKQEQTALASLESKVTGSKPTEPAAAPAPAPAPAPATPAPSAGGGTTASTESSATASEAKEKAIEAKQKAEEAKNAAEAAKGAAQVAQVAAEAAEKEAKRQADAAETSRGNVTSNIEKFEKKHPEVANQ